MMMLVLVLVLALVLRIRLGFLMVVKRRTCSLRRQAQRCVVWPFLEDDEDYEDYEDDED